MSRLLFNDTFLLKTESRRCSTQSDDEKDYSSVNLSPQRRKI